MELILHLQNLSPVATHMDVRHFFVGLDITERGVQIVGGEDGDAFINFRSEQDLLRALAFDNQPILGQCVKLFLAKEIDVQRIIEKRKRELDRDNANYLLAGSHTVYADDIESFHDPVRQSSSHRVYTDDNDRPSSSHRANADVGDRPSSSHRANADVGDRPSSSHRTNADVDDRPSSSHRTNADVDDRPSSSHRTNADVDDRPSGSHRTNADVDDRFDVQDRLSSTHSSYSDEDERFQDQDLSSSSYRARAEENRRDPDQNPPTHRFTSDPTNPFDQAVKQLLKKKSSQSDSSHETSGRSHSSHDKSGQDHSSSVKSRSEKRSGDHSRDRHHSSHSDKKLKQREEEPEFDMSLPFYVLVAQRDLKKKQQKAEAEKQKPAPTESVDVSPRIKQPRSDQSSKVNNADRDDRHTGDGRSRHRDDRPRGLQDSREKDSTKGKHRDRRNSSSKSGEDTPRDKSGKTSDRDPELECIALYNLDVTVTATDIRKFLRFWEVPDGGIILRTDKRDPNAIVAYITYYPMENVGVKTLDRTVLHGRPVDVKSVPLKLFNQEKSSRKTSDEDPKGVRNVIPPLMSLPCHAVSQIPPQKERVRRREQERENYRSRDKHRSSSKHHTVERKDPELECIALYNLDFTVTATDIRKFLKLWEIPDSGIILRTDKRDPNAIVAYITYYPKENVEVKTLIGTVVQGRPVEIKSVSLELFDREKASNQMVEKTPSPAPATGYPNYPPPHPGMYPGPMWMPQMPMPGYGLPPGKMAPPSNMPPPYMFPPRGMAPPPQMPPQLSGPPFPGYGNAWGPGRLGPFTPPGTMPLHYMTINPKVLPLHCSASEVWSWFGGLHGPTEHAILVTDSNRVATAAFVAFLDERQRDEEIVLRKEMRGGARTHNNVDCVLSRWKTSKVIWQSSESGVDTNITAQIPSHPNSDRNRIQQQRPRFDREKYSRKTSDKDPELYCIALYNLDVTVTATDIREFLKLWEIPDGGIILRTDKRDPNAIVAYITYYPKENVSVKTLIGTVLHGQPVDMKSVSLELFDREEASNQVIEETPPQAPATVEAGAERIAQRQLTSVNAELSVEKVESDKGSDVNAVLPVVKTEPEDINNSDNSAMPSADKTDSNPISNTDKEVKKEKTEELPTYCSGGKTVDDINSSANAVHSADKTGSDKGSDVNAVQSADKTKSDNGSDVNAVQSADKTESDIMSRKHAGD